MRELFQNLSDLQYRTVFVLICFIDELFYKYTTDFFSETFIPSIKFYLFHLTNPLYDVYETDRPLKIFTDYYLTYCGVPPCVSPQ